LPNGGFITSCIEILNSKLMIIYLDLSITKISDFHYFYLTNQSFSDNQGQIVLKNSKNERRIY
jgi:hypothetical protein